MVAFFLVSSSLSVFFSCTSSSAELITSLPGQLANVSFRQYSGYIVIDAQHGRALFYYFVEADSENPLSHPLTVWLNGGPGCSSLGFGAFMENGPFQPGNEGLLTRNEYSWNSVSNMLYLESPIGVGFSYSNTSSDYINWNDTTTGHYIPQLTRLLLEYNRQLKNKPIKLKAIALGNPLLDIEISIDHSEFLWSHGVISDELLAITKTVCNYSRYFLEWTRKNVSKECRDMFMQMREEVGNDTDSGDIIIPICVSPSTQSAFLGDLAVAKVAKKIAVVDPCLSDRIYAYLNNLGVQKALHVKPTRTPAAWNFCSGPLNYQRENMAANIIPLLEEILREHIPILLYSGDQDSKIPLTQTRKIANLLAKDLELIAFERYGPWYDGLQVGGWTQSFGRLKSSKNSTILTFATVKGAAHEVPFTSPSQALTLFKAFLKGHPPPRTNNI
ncbi:hypothetical protein ACH5RR_030563 [Cinchona calisaya]|uniref:Serine carboxypeptidase-like 45 n=1 Tax=Cinchona calisaya TaxID=153742 RepID=A0ABD2YY69_9GENT